MISNTLQHYSWTDRIWKQIANSQEKPSSLLLFGKPGLGKARLAIEYSLKLLSGSKDQNSVFTSGNHPDFHVIMSAESAKKISDSIDDEAVLNTDSSLLGHYSTRYTDPTKTTKSITVDQVRKLIEQVTRHSQLSEHKVILIKDTEKMTMSAANALLKTLEEPPKNTTFILLCTQAESLPITIRSRCVKYHFRTPNKEIGLDWLQKQGFHQHAESYLMMAGKSPLLAQELAEEGELEKLREIFTSINKLWRGEISTIDIAQAWKEYSLAQCLGHLHKLLLDVIKLKVLNDDQQGADTTNSTELFYPVQQSWTEKIAANANQTQLMNVLDELMEIKKLSKGPTDQQLLLENTAISFAKLAQARL